MSRNVIGAATVLKAAILIGCKHRIATTALLMAKNRLANEKSSYLLQHANNPINWYPWSEEAFNQAKATNRPIFLSIGYSTCHWCHVMAHESFENEEIAKILNDNFISIKVDREERPDVDRIYMSFVQTISSGGGWPLNVFLTPDLKPFTGGTYFPPRDMCGRLGFKNVLNVITEKWRTNGEEIAAAADQFVNVMKQSMKPRRDKLPPLEQVEKLCYNHLRDEFDELYKGFGSAPKFPNCVYLDFLLSFYCTNASSKIGENALRMVGETLLAMDRGGIHDHIGKGFHRYAVDSKWHVPHFEKMLYDQAQLLAVYSDYHRITGNFKNVIEDIADYIQTSLSHESGGFCSAEDADSLPSFASVKKCEGAYYLWMEKDIDEILKDKPPLDEASEVTYASIFKMFYNVKPNGNIPSCADPYDELKTQNILLVKESIETFAKKCSLSTEKLENVIDESKSALREAQKKRPRPHRDNKLLTSWNGLMISGLAKAAVALQNEEFIRRAQQIVGFLKKFLLVDGGMLRAAYLGNDGKIVENDSPVHAYADDYTYVIQGLLDLYEASFDEQLIKLAVELQEQMDEQFWDVEHDSGYHQAVEGPHIIFRIMDDQDTSEPSRNSVASVNLMRLYSITNRKVYRDRAQQILENAAERLRKYPFILTKMISAFQRYTCPPKQVIVLGSRSNRTTKQMLSLISKNFDCRRTLISMDPEEDLWLQSINDYLKQLAFSAPEISTVYICDNFACTMPITSLDELKAKFDSKKISNGSLDSH